MSAKKPSNYSVHPFRRAVFRGLGVVLPPLLTFVILLWIGNSIQKFVLNPVEWGSRQAMVWYMNETKTEVPVGADLIENQSPKVSAVAQPETQEEPAPVPTGNVQDDELQRLIRAITRLERRLDATSEAAIEASIDTQRSDERRFQFEDKIYVQLENSEWIPEAVRISVNQHVRDSGIALAKSTGRGYYDHYVEHQILKKAVVIPVFLAGFILLMYLLGRFLAAGVGRILWNAMESVIHQVPIIRTVYSSVKQVTDFFVGESEMEFKRVVAVEYPRRGMWSVGFVTGESLLTIRDAAHGDPIVSVLMPTSPVPGTGFTITVRKSETIDVDIPIEQALQFVVSCGVVIPDDESQEHIAAQIQATANRQFDSESGAIAVE